MRIIRYREKGTIIIKRKSKKVKLWGRERDKERERDREKESEIKKEREIERKRE